MEALRTSRHFMERRSATHVYFLTGPGSQWYPSPFEQSLAPDLPPRAFNCREQYVMARKKHVSRDREGVEAIMRVGPPDMAPVLELLRTDPHRALKEFNRYPEEQKRLGKTAPYDHEAWVADRPHAAYAGNIACFGQNPDMLRWLVGTGDRILVEGSSKDDLWGCGIRWDDPRILDDRNWKAGGNLLGRTLMRARAFHARHAYLEAPAP